MVRTSVCPSEQACADGHAAESTSLMALSGQSGTTQTVVLTNDNSASVAYTLRVKGLSSASVTATIRTPPSGRRDLATVGNPAKPDLPALASPASQ
ncbi:MAG: hypothetical protein IPO43_11545 [Rhodoferax sp.]|nr:hypothetical protein [Rhodoferax sp.]